MRGAMTMMALAGLLAGGIAAAPDATARGCGGQAYAPPNGEWGKPASGGASVWGHPGYKKTYRWTVEGDVGRARVALRGFDPQTNAETWYDALMWASGDSGAAKVPWGNNAATPAIRAMAPLGHPGVFVSFTC